MLKPEKGKKVVHYIDKQDVISYGGDFMPSINEKIDNYLSKFTFREVHGESIVESRAFVDNICMTNKVERIHGITHIGVDLNVDNEYEVLVTYHVERWWLFPEDSDESDPNIVDVQHYEGGWMQ